MFSQHSHSLLLVELDWLVWFVILFLQLSITLEYSVNSAIVLSCSVAQVLDQMPQNSSLYRHLKTRCSLWVDHRARTLPTSHLRVPARSACRLDGDLAWYVVLCLHIIGHHIVVNGASFYMSCYFHIDDSALMIVHVCLSLLPPVSGRREREWERRISTLLSVYLCLKILRKFEEREGKKGLYIHKFITVSFLIMSLNP